LNEWVDVVVLSESEFAVTTSTTNLEINEWVKVSQFVYF